MIRQQSSDNGISERLREAIARRNGLRPGSRRHWQAECEVRVLQNALVDPVSGEPALGIRRSREASLRASEPELPQGTTFG